MRTHTTTMPMMRQTTGRITATAAGGRGQGQRQVKCAATVQRWKKFINVWKLQSTICRATTTTTRRITAAITTTNRQREAEPGKATSSGPHIQMQITSSICRAHTPTHTHFTKTLPTPKRYSNLKPRPQLPPSSQPQVHIGLRLSRISHRFPSNVAFWQNYPWTKLNFVPSKLWHRVADRGGKGNCEAPDEGNFCWPNLHVSVAPVIMNFFLMIDSKNFQAIFNYNATVRNLSRVLYREARQLGHYVDLEFRDFACKLR